MTTKNVHRTKHTEVSSAGQRSTLDVLNSHIVKTLARRIEEDLEFNYSQDIVLFTAGGIHHGRWETLKALQSIESELDSTSGHYEVAEFSGDYAFIERSCTSLDGQPRRVAESLFLQNGRIAIQMVHVLL